jgi:hypothetical protein
LFIFLLFIYVIDKARINVFAGGNHKVAEWDKTNESSEFRFDIKLPENRAGVQAKKNRTITLSVVHWYIIIC